MRSRPRAGAVLRCQEFVGWLGSAGGWTLCNRPRAPKALVSNRSEPVPPPCFAPADFNLSMALEVSNINSTVCITNPRYDCYE